MLQKLLTVPALGAVLLILTAYLFVGKIDLGFASNLPRRIGDVSGDPSSSLLFAASEADAQPVKLASAESKPVEVKPAQAKIEPKVEAITITKAAPMPAPEDIEGMIRKYAAEYGANPEVMLIIAKCESGFRQDAISPSGAYKGMYQFVASTWQSNRRAMGLDDNPALMLNAEEAIRTAAFKMGRDGYGAWPVCSQKAFSQLALN